MDQVMQIRSALASEQLPTPSRAWLLTLISQLPPQQRTLPILVATAKARLLALDLTTSLLFDESAQPALFPRVLLAPATSTVTIQDMCLAYDIVVQVIDLENLSQSRWQQVQALEAIERGEQKRGRQIIRIPVGGGGDDDNDGDGGDGTSGGPRPAAAASSGPSDASATHRLVLQDAAGHRLFAVELFRIHRIGIGRLRMGEKLLLKKNTVIARGMLLLEPAYVKFLGGQVERMHKAWVDERLERLRDAAQYASEAK